MVSKPVFTGAATALITPMHGDQTVDYETFGRLIDWQISEGISALVIAGTTGEGSTLSDTEHLEVLRYAAERANGRVAMVAGTGSNNTAHSIELSKEACGFGYDALLCVTPYYNKTTQAGLVKTYQTIADAVTKPLILYNVPSRTGVNIEPATYAALADHPNIAGIKEANGNMSKIVETVSLVGDKLALYSGNDDQIVPLMSMGGKGVISVLSNVLPAKTQQICSLFFDGKVAEAAALQCELLPLINALFCEVNPIPVKAAMAALGYGENVLRLPLIPMSAAHREMLMGLMQAQGLNVE